MKRYILEVVIEEGSDEWWESIPDDLTGCDEVLRTVRDVLFDAGFQPPDCTVTLKHFSDAL